jgi:two-component system, NtrC family, sensor kinase
MNFNPDNLSSIDSTKNRHNSGPAGAPLSNCRNSLGKLPEGIEEFFNAAHEAIILYAEDLRIVWANKGTLAMFELSSREIVGHHCHKSLFNSLEPCEICPVRRCFQSGKQETAHVKSATGRFFELQAMPMFDKSGSVEYVLEFANDVTEKVKLHAEALRTDHLSSLGELAAGVAHEINNPINGIINYAQMLVNLLSRQSPECDIARRIIIEGERIADIVQSLLTFAEQDNRGRVIISLADLLSDCLSLTRAQLKDDGIRLRVDIEADLPLISVNSKQMCQVFLNLISNARHALNEKFPQGHEDKVLRINGNRIDNDFGTFVSVGFHDQGAGIPPEALEMVLMPFYSTKAAGKGNGLGLSSSRNILIQHNGTIRIDSTYGEYTRVTVEVPIPET